MNEVKDNQKAVTLRQRLAIKLLMMAIAILAPFEYTHQWKEWHDDFIKHLNGNA